MVNVLRIRTHTAHPWHTAAQTHPPAPIYAPARPAAPPARPSTHGRGGVGGRGCLAHGHVPGVIVAHNPMRRELLGHQHKCSTALTRADERNEGESVGNEGLPNREKDGEDLRLVEAASEAPTQHFADAEGLLVRWSGWI